MISHIFCECEIWEQLHWVILSQRLSQDCSQDIAMATASSEGLVGAGGSTFEVVPSHGW